MSDRNRSHRCNVLRLYVRNRWAGNQHAYIDNLDQIVYFRDYLLLLVERGKPTVPTTFW